MSVGYFFESERSSLSRRCSGDVYKRQIETEGYEADDILGTLSAMGEADGDTRVFIFTGDRDSLQLISGKTSVVLATNKENILFDEARFLAEYGVCLLYTSRCV